MEQIDKAKLLEWINYGLERSKVQRDFYAFKNDVKFLQVCGGEDMLKTLKEQLESGTFNIKEPKQQFSVERDSWGHAQTIKEGNRVVLWLLAGAERNEEEADRIVALLNKNPIQGEKTDE